jgi:hypothetical protein
MQILKSSNPQIFKSSNLQIFKSSKSSVKTFARLSSLIAIVSFECISQAQACNSIGNGNWSSIGWNSCSTSPPAATENVTIFGTVTLDQNVAVNQITLATGTLNAANFTLTLTATEPLMNVGSTFNADTSTVKLSDADHSFSTSSFTFYNLQWATPLTAPRTVTIAFTITKATGGTFNLDGTAANPVTFAGAGNFASMVTVNNCAGKPATMTNLTCNAPIVNNPVSAPIDLHFSKQPETFATEIKIK